MPFPYANAYQVNGQVAIKKMRRTFPDDEAQQRNLDALWQNEIEAHQEFTKLGDCNIIKFIAAIGKDRERYLMLEWADGGNLREFWASNPHLSRTLVKDTIHQLYGLADALEGIHGKNYRHGNIKPENILRKKTHVKRPGSSGLDVGALKIGGMGLATKVQTGSAP